MRSFRIFNRRAGALFAAAGLVFATMVPALASAATVTDRSIALSNSAKSNVGTIYDVDFKAATANTGAVVVDFCTTPNIGAACTTPTGFDIVTIGTTSAHTVTGVDSNTAKIVLSSSVGAGAAVAFDISGITNPSTVSTIYARIVTYTDGSTNYGYVAADDLDNGGGGKVHLDDGSVAISINNGFDVSGRVLETMVFCASGAALTLTDCSDATAPSVTLGAGGILDTSLSTGTVYTLVSTNAASGAVVNLKSNTTGCGGLSRVGASSFATGCGITPLTSAGSIGTGAAKFGVQLSSPTATTGQLNVVGSYSTSNYFMNWVSGDATGVTSPYGDPIYNTNDAPVNVGKTNLTFGANISNVTPAGYYTASMSLIATGKF